MSYKNIKTGDTVEISLKLESGKSSKSYTTKTEIVNSEKEILIHVPSAAGQLVKLPLSDRYSMLFITDTGMYRFSAAINGYTAIDGFRYMSCSLISEGQKVQRRQYFRHSYSVDFNMYKYLDDKLVRDEIFECRLIDISGGGIKFYSNKILDRNDKINVMIDLKHDSINLDARIIASMRLEGDKNLLYRYQYRTSFVNIEDTIREKIIQFVFNEQRNKLKRSI